MKGRYCAAAGQIVLSEAVQNRLSSPPESTVAELIVKDSDEAVHARIASPLPAGD